MGVENRDELIEHPTWLDHVRFFFDAQDIECMKREMNIDLATYEGVKRQARRILMQTLAGNMPPQHDRKWPANRIKTFENWIADKCPMGAATLAREKMQAIAFDAAGPQVRRNAATLSNDEVELLKKAFSGIMARETTDPKSYFAIAGVHWFPDPHCVHHAPHYNPWHRVYMDRFEAALRSVDGCENIKMPYWDILQPVPAWLFQAPFDSYTIPVDVSPTHPAGTKTQRFSKEVIEANIAEYRIGETIKRALDAPQWDTFTRTIEQAHDDGHVSIGPAATGMGRPSVAAFDPIFWFFHCNWERMWWAWQDRHDAGTLGRFRQTIDQSDTRWLDDPAWNQLEPFAVAADQTIDSTPYAYENLPMELFAERAFVESGNVPADRSFRLGITPKLSVRVKGIERLRIKGTFIVHLLGDGQLLARHAFFQAEEPTSCPNCLERAKVDIDLLVDRHQALGKKLEVKIESLEPGLAAPWVPLSEVGSPTINVRELLASE